MLKVARIDGTDLMNAVAGARTCWDSMDKSDSDNKYIGVSDMKLLDRLFNKTKHESVFEHAVNTFYVSGISRAVLQEIVRHRMNSISVKSTRFTLKKLAKSGIDLLKGKTPMELRAALEELSSDEIESEYGQILEDASAHLVLIGNHRINLRNVINLHELLKEFRNDTSLSNDVGKYGLTEALKVSLVISINLRSMKNMLRLRLASSALPEFRILMHGILQEMPRQQYELLKPTVDEVLPKKNKEKKE